MKPRTRSWQALLESHGPAFLEWLAVEGIRWRRFSDLADSWDRLLDEFLMDEKSCDAFMKALPKVVSQCNQDIYEDISVALAFAHVYLLERYRRFFDVLTELVRSTALPLADHGVRVLDVGTGPAPVLYAVSDFYEAFTDFARVHGIDEATHAHAELHAVESSRAMTHLMHLLSEWSQRPGPFLAQYDDFGTFDPDEARKAERRQWIAELMDLDEMSEEQARWWVREHGRDIDGAHRFLLCTFSNFLTRKDLVRQQRSRIEAAFWSVRPGGVAVVIGARGGEYPAVYSEISRIASKARLFRVDMPTEIPCTYNDPEAYRIKQSWDRVWKRLKTASVARPDMLADAPDLWDPGKPFTGPPAFSVRAFRRGN